VRAATSNPPGGAIGGFEDGSFAAVFDTSGEALLIIDARGVIQRVNRRARELLGMPEGVSRQNELADFLPQTGNGRFAFLPETRAPGAPYGVDAALRSGVPVRVTLRSILPGSLHLLLCVEERGFDKAAETERHQLNAALRSALDSMQAGIALIDLSGRVRYLSPQFGELFGLDATQLEKISTFDELSEEAAGRLRSPEIFSTRWKTFRAEIASWPRKKWRSYFRDGAFWSGSQDRYSIPGSIRRDGWKSTRTLPITDRSNRKCCRPKRWPRWERLFRGSHTS
jgi:PAS domain-containing protein